MPIFATGWDAANYALAGNAKVTLTSRRTGARFTYKITAAEQGNAWFVALLSGPNNDADYTYLGLLNANKQLVRTRKSRVGADAPSWRAFDFFARRVLVAGDMPAKLECRHEGSCGRCGRTLTVPESIDSGIGPECAKRIGGGTRRNRAPARSRDLNARWSALASELGA